MGWGLVCVCMCVVVFAGGGVGGRGAVVLNTFVPMRARVFYVCMRH